MAKLWEMQLLNKLSALTPFPALCYTFSELQPRARHLQTCWAFLHQAFVDLVTPSRAAFLFWSSHFPAGEILHSCRGQINSLENPSMPPLLPWFFHKAKLIHLRNLTACYSFSQRSTYMWWFSWLHTDLFHSLGLRIPWKERHCHNHSNKLFIP